MVGRKMSGQRPGLGRARGLGMAEEGSSVCVAGGASVSVRGGMRLAAISFYSDGPVRAGFLELGDVTALIGANDVGKTRLLGLIETALSDPEGCDMIDLFGVWSAEEVAAFIDPEAFARLHIGELVDSVAEFADDLQEPALRDGGLRVGVRLPACLGTRRRGGTDAARQSLTTTSAARRYRKR